jgi:hypothetical protein
MMRKIIPSLIEIKYNTMNYILTFVIFTIILFLYVHIVAEYSRSEDLEIYEMDYIDNKQFQEVCNIKQPVLFEFKTVEPRIFQEMTISILANNTNDEIKIVDSNDYWKNTDTVDYISVPLQTAHKLMETDINSHFFTEQNGLFMDENKFSSKLASLDHYFKPYATIQTKTDFLMGSKHCTLPLRYHTDYRHLLCVASGKIHVKMTPWKSSKYLSPIQDFEKYEFRSSINVWNPQQKYMHEMDKIKFLDFDVMSGYVLCIPSYWWYSIKYSDEPDTCAFTCTYNTVVNRLAHITDIGRYMLQQQNITKKITKTVQFASQSIEIPPQHQEEDIITKHDIPETIQEKTIEILHNSVL